MITQDPVLQRLIDQVRSAHKPLDIQGGNTKHFYGEIPHGEVLDMRPLTGISSYEPSELVVTVRAGTRLAELEARLAEKGQCLPFEPPRFGPDGTVGGMVAAGLSGPSRASVGCVRDYVLGTTVLNGQGEVLSFGGQVIKNVAGYDVSRVMAGSLGVLGVICEVSLKVLPIATATATRVFAMDEAAALKQLNAWAGQPLPINASAWHHGQLHLRLAGAQAAVTAACAKLGGTVVEPEIATSWWDSVRDHQHAFFHLDSNHLAKGEHLWRLSVPATTPPLDLPGVQCIEWGGAQRWLRGQATVKQVRAAAVRAGGHATLFRGAAPRTEVFTPLSAPLQRIHKGLKTAFDPRGIFNPGRMYPGL
ncbi:glycolate oxidase subunit GlcE [Rhodoferax sp.]|uniref:glycolate oxidase subunit GlcE n=1 Tax=Rhodoferax sp. TaxID=50421 RepID=UPI0025E57E5F|nr:glycolate oxidase subunit GlcE [Rhodoferax sp.]